MLFNPKQLAIEPYNNVVFISVDGQLKRFGRAASKQGHRKEKEDVILREPDQRVEKEIDEPFGVFSSVFPICIQCNG